MIKKTILITFVIFSSVLSLSSSPFVLGSLNYQLNPALISFGRQHIGAEALANFGNNYKDIKLGDFIDGNYEPKDLLNDQTFYIQILPLLKFNLGFFSLGFLSDIESKLSINIEPDFINSVIEKKSDRGSGLMSFDVKMRNTIYLGLASNEFAIGAAVFYQNVLVDFDNEGVDYSFENEENSYKIKGELTSQNSYSSMRYSLKEILEGNADTSNLFDKAGIGLNVGFVAGKNGKPMFGMSLNNLTIRPVTLDKYEYTMKFEQKIEYNDETEEINTSPIEIKESSKNLITNNASQAKIGDMNFSMFLVIPLGLDFTTYISYYPDYSEDFDLPIVWGIGASTKFLRIVPIWFNLERNTMQNLWKADVGLGLDIYILDVEFRAGIKTDKDIMDVNDLMSGSTDMYMSIKVGAGF